MKNLHCLGVQKSTEGKVKHPIEAAKESSLRKLSELLGAAKCSPVPEKLLPATIPSAIGETTHPPTPRKGTPTPKTLSEAVYCKRSERACDDNVLTEGSEEEQLPWRREGQRTSEARFCGGGARRTQRRGGEARGIVGRKGGGVGGNNGAERKDARRRGGFEF
jgi:hypothetical protein